MVSSTGCRSNGERLMTLSTSAVAVCLLAIGQFAVRACTSSNSRDVLDRDHRLVGEVRDQLDLLVGERPHLVRSDTMTPIGLSLAQQRDTEQVSDSRAFCCASSECVFRIRREHPQYA